jgi:alcohol dehydrogenase, propanol-preferring
MKAAVVTAFDQPLEIQEVSVPTPGPDQVLVRIEASGLCHTDIHAAQGDWPVKPTPPFTPGHEGVGTIAAVGANATMWSIGDRVAIPWLGYACGRCEYCITGRETLCTAQHNTGYSIDGAHAEYTVADARFVVAVPDGVAVFDAAPLTCAGVTTYKAIKVAGVRPAERVGVFGIGGLGHLAQQYAQIFGAETVAVDVTEDKLRLARDLGAQWTINARTSDPVAEIRDLGGIDVAVVLAASPRVIEQAFASLRRGGRMVLVSLPKDNAVQIPVFETVLGGLTIIGSIVGTRADLAEVFRLHASGKTRVELQVRKLDEINQAITDVLGGQVPARVVFAM